MPLYEYQCEACGRRFEVIQKFSDPRVEACKLCGEGPVQRLISTPAIQFKGTGWYITDYARKGKPSASGESSGGEGGEKKAGTNDSTSQGDTKTSSSGTDSTAGKSDSKTSTPTPAASSDKK